MIIQLNSEKIIALEDIIKEHEFAKFLGFTAKFKGFEVCNFYKEIKMSVLSKLSPENWREVPDFKNFSAWFKKLHGTAASRQICKYMFPDDDKSAKYMQNCMRGNTNHDWWKHIEARLYKMWCSILTEMQAVYAVVSGAEAFGLNWKVIASAELDSYGVDFMIVTETSAIPVQIKKDSYHHQQAQGKQNGKENFSRFNVTKKALKSIEQELVKAKITVNVESGLLVKYGLFKKGVSPYEYLEQFGNGFVYFNSIKLVQSLNEIFNQQTVTVAANDSQITLAV